MKTSRLSFYLSLLGTLSLLHGIHAAPSRTSRKPKNPDAASQDAASTQPAEPSAPAAPVDNSPPIKPIERLSVADLSAAFFMEALSPYGTWHEIEGFGHCWKPKVDQKWRPYTLGEWVYSNHGWTWLSTENFGGIVYHYGRWARLQPQGWFWIPDLEWAASWVSWRYGSKYVGWAPLPPDVKWNTKTGIGPWVDRDYKIGPDNYVFCEVTDIGNKDLHKVLLPANTNPSSVLHSVNITNTSRFQQTIFSGGPSYDWLASRSTEPVAIAKIVKERSLVKFREQLQIASENSTLGAAVFKSILQNGYLTVMAPEWGILVDPRKADALGFSLPEKDEAQKRIIWSEGETTERKASLNDSAKNSATIKAPKLIRGWEYFADEDERRTLQSKVSREVAGLTAQLNPAKPFDPKKDVPSSVK